MATPTKTASKKTESPEPVPEATPEELAELEAREGKSEQAEQANKETLEAIETLDPTISPREWMIGKPPGQGGTEDEYSIYVQEPLTYMKRIRFFALCTSTITKAMKEGADVGELFGGGSMRDRARELSESDFADAGSFMSLALTLVSYAPEFLLDCYVLWLDVPAIEKNWAKKVMNTEWNPEKKRWGLTDDQHLEIVETFIDQNYMEIREFFTGKLPRLADKVRAHETARRDHESESAPSKQ